MTIQDKPTSIYQNSAQLWSALIIDQFIKNGVTSFFPSPGMRNAPLLKAIKSQPDAEIYLGVDERAQSYRALAHTKLTKKPSVLICTSGTALANYLPAIIEARKTHLPLFVLSADRPGELLATDANQTINQIEALRNYTKSFWQASEPQKNFPPRALAGKISFLINDACMDPVGPMHINIPLREPIDETSEQVDPNWEDGIAAILDNDRPALEFPTIKKDISPQLIDTLLTKLTDAKKPLIIFGPLTSWEQQSENEVKSFIESYGGNFSCDITSSLP
jgi:2-succinyl-5-enolpyruvyl-6-hydroxy-3-cyclohexene-1-carboxylate synthase